MGLAQNQQSCSCSTKLFRKNMISFEKSNWSLHLVKIMALVDKI